MLPTNAKLQILPQRCIVAPATRIEPADNHLAPKTSTNHLTMRPAAEERMKAMLGDDRPTPPPTCSPHAVNPTSVVLTKKDTRTCPLTTPPPSAPPPSALLPPTALRPLARVGPRSPGSHPSSTVSPLPSSDVVRSPPARMEQTNPPLGPGSEGTAAARPPGGLHAGMPSSHKVMERPPSAPEVQAGGRPEAHRTATSPRCPTKKGRAAGPRACPEGPAARRVASQAGW